MEKIKKNLSDRTKELEIAKHLIEQTARLHLNKPPLEMQNSEPKSESEQVKYLREELTYSQNTVATLYTMLEDERRTHYELNQKQKRISQKTLKWRRRSVKAIPKAPAPPKNVVKIAELEDEIEEFSQIIRCLVEDKHQLVEMNTQLLGQIKTFLREPPAQFLEFHMKEQVEKK